MVACPRCGARFVLEPVIIDETVTSWIGMGPVPTSAGPSRLPLGTAGHCAVCGYSGPMLADETMAYPDCPACGASQRDRAIGRWLRVECPECEKPIEAERGKSVVCPHCKRFLGCLNPEEPKPRWWRGLGRGKGPGPNVRRRG